MFNQLYLILEALFHFIYNKSLAKKQLLIAHNSCTVAESPPHSEAKSRFTYSLRHIKKSSQLEHIVNLVTLFASNPKKLGILRKSIRHL